MHACLLAVRSSSGHSDSVQGNVRITQWQSIVPVIVALSMCEFLYLIVDFCLSSRQLILHKQFSND